MTFNQFLETCKNDVNGNQQNVKDTFKKVWKPLLDHFRAKGYLPDQKSTKNIILNGIIEYNLTDEEAFFILAHTGSYSSWVNFPLRNSHDLPPCQNYFAEGLDQSLSKLPSFNDEIVYRMENSLGEKNVALNWFRKNKGSVVELPYFLSTSKVKWSSTEMTWEIKTLDKGSKAKDLNLITNNKTEQEVLFQRNSLFEITNVNRKIVEMKEVGHSNLSLSLTGYYFEK